ncbi:beta-lactamase-like protein [Geopyxis carbonaria]|nr:beta-lactamase-like protein [Geopyxis carbonaria]
MHIQSLPMWTGSHDNYAYLVVDEETKDAMIIDPANPPEVLPVLQEKIKAGEINLKAIINTHHHGDHAGGNTTLLKAFPNLPVIGGKDCAAVTTTPAHNSTFPLGARITVTALHTPCHTQDSICFSMVDAHTSQRAVFTGDTLFIGGCGRFFEGSAAEMHTALNETLAALPEETTVWPGHEYTKSNIKFGRSVVDDEPVRRLVAFCEGNKETQGRFTIGDEKKHNVFMRLDDPAVQAKTGQTEPVEVMKALREMKNAFK